MEKWESGNGLRTEQGVRSLAKNSFPIKLYPFALIYWFHALSPLSTAAAVSSSNNNKISLQNPILKFSIFHLPFNFSAARKRFL